MKKLMSIIISFLLAISSFAQVEMTRQEEGVLITEKGRNVLFFQTEPKSKDGTYTRCNYIHPVWGMNGEVLTEDFPADHLHHRGVFWTWHQVWIGEKRIGDPWEIKDFDQKVQSIIFKSLENGAGQLNTIVDWMSPLWKKDGKVTPYMKEKTTIVIHPGNDNFRKIDFEIRLLALEENLAIGGSEDIKGYSGFSVRMKLPDDVQFYGINGMVEPQNTAVASPGFINIFGTLTDENKGGIVIADHSGNPGYPQNWILRSRRSMQNAAYPGNIVIPVSTSDPLVLKYSLIIYTGEIDSKEVQKIIGAVN